MSLAPDKNLPDNYRIQQNNNGRMVYFYKSECLYKKPKKVDNNLIVEVERSF
jgi:hypothetical protein